MIDFLTFTALVLGIIVLTSMLYLMIRDELERRKARRAAKELAARWGEMAEAADDMTAYLHSRLRHPSMRNRHPEMDDDE